VTRHSKGRVTFCEGGKCPNTEDSTWKWPRNSFNLGFSQGRFINHQQLVLEKGLCIAQVVRSVFGGSLGGHTIHYEIVLEGPFVSIFIDRC
jgi:hypothetical protein